MVLIATFLISTILIAVNIDPFRAAGFFLSICYLPGLCIFAAFKRDKLVFEDFVLAYPCSIGISGILILGLLFIGVHVEQIPVIIHIAAGIAVFLIVITKKYKRLSISVDISRRELIFSLFALSVIIILSIPFLLGLNRLAIAAHAFHHSLIMTQIVNGIFPPENPGLGGTTIGYYWGFHSLIAVLASKTNLQPLQIAFAVNMISLYMIFCIAYSFAKAFDLNETYRYILPLAVIGLMRSDAGIFFIMNLFSGNTTPLAKLITSPLEPSNVLVDWITGIPWFDPRLFYVRKFYNVSGMPLAVSLCLSYLLLLLLSLKKSAGNTIYLRSAGVVIAACILNYPPLAIFPLLHAPIWTGVDFLSKRGLLKDKIKGSLEILVPYIIAILLVLPYLLFIIAARDVSSGGQGSIFSFDFYSQSFRNMAVFLVPLPIIIAGAWIAYKRLSFSRELIFLLTGTALCLGLAIVTRWPFDNSYKFNYILTFFFALFFVFALSYWLPLITVKWLKRLITAGIVVFLLFNPLMLEATYVVASFSTERRLTFSGRHILYAQDKELNGAYTWIAENTPPESLLMLGYTETEWPCCGMNDNYEHAALAERNLYVIKDADYTTSNPEYTRRVRFREKLFENPEAPEVISFFRSLNRPVYLLVEENLAKRFLVKGFFVKRFLVEDRFKQFPEDPGAPFVLVYQNDMQRVYRLEFKNGLRN